MQKRVGNGFHCTMRRGRKLPERYEELGCWWRPSLGSCQGSHRSNPEKGTLPQHLPWEFSPPQTCQFMVWSISGLDRLGSSHDTSEYRHGPTGHLTFAMRIHRISRQAVVRLNVRRIGGLTLRKRTRVGVTYCKYVTAGHRFR